MPPKQPPPGPPYEKGERIFCFHQNLLYEAKVIDITPQEAGEGWLYKVHYKGWKDRHDEWAPQDRLRKFNDENKELASQIKAQFSAHSTKSTAKQTKANKLPGKVQGSELGSARGSEERMPAATQSGRGPRRARDYELEPEDAFHSRPSIKLPMADHLKAKLVDDWENVTKSQQLVPIPHPHPVDEILEDYLAHERPNCAEGSPEMDVLEEVVAGIRVYFNKALGRLLLYKFERPQYTEIYKMWEDPASDKKTPCDTYGAEHLCRLLVSLPELIAQTNMDQQSVNRLRDELTKFTGWLAKHSVKYFVSEYESPGQEYVDKARA